MMKFCKTFLILFIFGLLISPLFHINMADKIKQENRTLAKFPKIKKDEKVNYEFGKDFETWLGDRFGGRNKLINFRFKTLYKVNNRVENNKAFMNSDGYIYLKHHIGVLKEPIDTQDMSIIRQNLSYLSEWCDKNKIKLYILIVPTRENLVLPDSEYVPPRPDLVEKHISELSDLPINILYPKDLYENKKYDDYPFYHTDHHWTEFGAFKSYQVLTERIKKDFPKLHSCSEDEFNTFYAKKVRNGDFQKLFNRSFVIGYCCPQVGLDKGNCPLAHKYRYYDHKMKPKLNVSMGSSPMSRVTHFNEVENNLKMTLLGYSSNIFLMSFLPFSVRDLQMLRVNNQEKNEKLSMARFEKHILDFKPNILVLSIRDSHFIRFKELYKNP